MTYPQICSITVADDAIIGETYGNIDHFRKISGHCHKVLNPLWPFFAIKVYFDPFNFDIYAVQTIYKFWTGAVFLPGQFSLWVSCVPGQLST